MTAIILIVAVITPFALLILGMHLITVMFEAPASALETVGYLCGGLLCFVLLAGYIYAIWRVHRADRNRNAGYEATVNILSNRANSGEFTHIYVNLKTCSAYLCRADGSQKPFSFYEYGYNDVNSSSILGILRNLEYKLDGFLSVQYEDYAVYDPSITVTHGTIPGGGDGYYVNVGGYDTGSMPTCAYLYLGDVARQKRNEAKRNRKKSLKSGGVYYVYIRCYSSVNFGILVCYY